MHLPDSLNTVWGMGQVVVMSHSWGDNVFRNFLHWITDLEPDFAEQHLEAYLDIAGPILGVPKSFSALLSGEFPLAAPHTAVTVSIGPPCTKQLVLSCWSCSAFSELLPVC